MVTDDLQPELPKAPAPKVRPGLEEETSRGCGGSAAASTPGGTGAG